MKKHMFRYMILPVAGLLLPGIAEAQVTGTEADSLHAVLQQVYTEMLPLSGQLISVGRGLAGFAALWYIGSRIWHHLANAEPVDFYPLLRPFALGIAILLFPAVLSLLNGVLQPTVAATNAMVAQSNKAIAVLLQHKEAALRKSEAWQIYVGADGNGDREKWYKYTHPEAPTGDSESLLDRLGNDVKFAMAKASYSFRHSVKQWMAEILELLFIAAALCINTIRTFYLIILSILGPLVLGFAVFDGFHHSLTVWLARYVNVFLWLPVSNIFGSIIGKIQENMLRLDISQVEQSGDTFFSPTDTAYLVFLLIGIIGYCTVPSVANYIVHAGGGNTLLYKVTNLLGTVTQTTTAAAGTGTRYVSRTPALIARHFQHAGTAGVAGNNREGLSPASRYQHNRLSGNS